MIFQAVRFILRENLVQCALRRFCGRIQDFLHLVRSEKTTLFGASSEAYTIIIVFLSSSKLAFPSPVTHMH